MSVKYLRINGGDLVPLDTVKRLSVVGELERQSLANLGPQVDANRFNTRIESADGKKSYAPETLDEIAAQGIGLIELDEGVCIPADNVVKARNLTEQDRDRFYLNKGREMPERFTAQVETKAGPMLAVVPAESVLERRANAASRAQPRKSMAETRDAVMEQASSAPVQEAELAPVKTVEPSREL